MSAAVANKGLAFPPAPGSGVRALKSMTPEAYPNAVERKNHSFLKVLSEGNSHPTDVLPRRQAAIKPKLDGH